MKALRVVVALACLGSAGGDALWGKRDFEGELKPFLETYCINCHGEEKQKGDRRFDTLAYPILNDDALIDYQDILDLLNLGEMPPEEKKQPSDGERLAAIDWLTGAVEEAYAAQKDSPGETVLRRLSHREYRNTIGDLLRMDMSMFDPTESFPGDRMVEHLDNVGEVLVTSGYLLDRYIEAADLSVEKALEVREKLEPREWRFAGDFWQQSELNSRQQWAHGKRYLNIYESPHSDLYFGSYAPLLAMGDGVPVSGTYKIRVLAEAVNRRHGYDRKRVTTNPDEPMLMRIVPGHRRFGKLHLPQPYEPDLGTFEVPDDEPGWLETRVWLDKGFSPRFSYPNGMMNIRRAYTAVAKVEKKRLKGSIPDEELKEDDKAFAIRYGVPHIRIHEVVIEGPFYDEWPTASWKAIIGEDEFQKADTRRILEDFASRAYRRPALTSEVNALMKVVDASIDRGRTPFDSLKGGLKAVLSSPAFLYLDEPEEGEREIDDYALVSRLSYFLWSTMPDESLLRLAEEGEIRDETVLANEIQRMLEDPRSDAFVSGFLDSWLTLRALGDTPPDRRKFERYYADHLEEAMREETERFTRDLLDTNGKIVRFLDADYSFLNGPLAALYGVKGVQGNEFRRVDLSDKRRGGLLGQASVLTVTANGVDTSPVYRGIWLLENLLGTPPSPPPPDVEPLDPDIRGATTIREQLAKHRNVASCNECHRKIDPLGFALENFDAIGAWRHRYEEGGAIDASGRLADGTEFEGVAEFREAMIGRKEQFSRALTEKMLAYALGRRIEILDRPVVDGILNELEDENGGFRDLVVKIAMSEAFGRM
ncbi:MAG: DUF1592 domain-containing protein [Verrucomicrobiota bacterium]